MSGKKKQGDPAGQPWLDALEARVQDAVERLTALAAENRRLGERVVELEARLVEAETATTETEGSAPGAVGEVAADWRRERDEVRRRIRHLAQTLESLLDDASG
jgi:DNA repair exonuclease SbcCD ATPase subunit